MRRGTWIVAILLLAAAVWLAWGMRPSDRAQIARRLDRIAADAIPGAREAAFDQLARAARLSSCLTVDARLELGESSPPVEGREAIIGIASHAVTEGPARLTLADIGVTIEPGGATARATMTATLVTRDRESGGDLVDAREVETDWVKQDGEWRIRRAALVRTLAR